VISPFAGLVPGGLDGQTHFLTETSAEEAADAVVLPSGHLGYLGHRRPLGAAQEGDNESLLAALPGYGRLLLGWVGLRAGGLRFLHDRTGGLGFFRAVAGVPPHLGQTKLPAATPTSYHLRRRSLALLGRAGSGNQREGALNEPVFRRSGLAVPLVQFSLVRAGKPVSAKSTSAGLRRPIPIRCRHIQFYITSEVIPQPAVASVLGRAEWGNLQEGALNEPVGVRPGLRSPQNS
jgi:hypothetical protein